MTTARRLGRAAVAGVAALTLTLGASAPAMAWLHPGSTTQYPSEGGTWQYGFWNVKVRSYYYHASRCHGSTVEYNGGRQRSVDTAAGRTSSATKGAVNQPWASDRYWYRTSCG
ncbi:lactococcin 972 family bacteriocin [Allokutzneria sp. NRRL B-24872]|uniref:lactococcin 972 family bacteriocin n=1 Tax=Allokutzneria sp. NRRL B-24872 TaxID=1137961 RepID=UPI000A3ABCCD|nr:lactococcin 972 family bacteriocin [Allokutzneria sp. NRRL B-24872]